MQFGIREPQDLFVPADLPKERPLPHASPRARNILPGGLDNLGPGAWTEFGGQFETRGNELYTTMLPPARRGRNSDLSSRPFRSNRRHRTGLARRDARRSPFLARGRYAGIAPTWPRPATGRCTCQASSTADHAPGEDDAATVLAGYRARGSLRHHDPELSSTAR